MKKLLLLSALLIFSFTMRAQVKFQDLYGDVNLDVAQAIKKTFDGGYIMVGSTGPNSIDSSEVGIFRLNANGDLVWSSRAEAYKDDFINDVVQMSDGNFLLVGSTYSSPLDTVYSDIVIIKVDDSGFVIWSKVFGGADFDEAQSVVDLGNDQYVILGNTWSYGTALKSALAIKIDANGTQLWSEINSTTVSNFYYGGAKTTAGFIAVGGTFNNAGGTEFDHYITNFDSSGNILWNKRCGTTGSDWSYAVHPVSSGGFIVAGVSVVNTEGSSDMNIFKLDNSGNTVWNYNYGGAQYERPSSILETPEGNFVVAGYTNVGDSVNVINQDLLFEISSDGTILWAHTYGDVTATSECYSMISTGDGYALAGYTIGFQTGNIGDAYLVKTDTAGNSGCYESNFNLIRNNTTFTDSLGTSDQLITINESTAIYNTTLQINQFGQICFTDGTNNLDNIISPELFPNPVVSTLHIRMNDAVLKGKITVKDIAGRTILSLETDNQDELQIPVAGLSPGMYFVSIQDDQRSYSTSFIHQ